MAALSQLVDSVRVAAIRGARGRAFALAGEAPAARAFRLALLVFAGYYLGAKLGLALTFPPHPTSILWPPNSVLFAALLLASRRAWWVVFTAALPAHLLAEVQGGVPLSMVLCWFISNSAEALIGAAFVRRFVPGRLSFDKLFDVVVLVLATFVAAFLSSFLDSGFVALNGWGSSGYWEVWRTRLFSNVTTGLIVIPLILIAASRGFVLRLGEPARLIEALVLVGGLFAITFAVFDSHTVPAASPALVCLPLPFLLWAAMRFGPFGASAAFAAVAFLVIWGSGHGMGPFTGQLPRENVLSVQLFLIFLSPTLLCLAAALAERIRAEHSLRASDRRFQLVLQATKDTVYERDLATDELWWSDAGLGQFGYTRSECPTDGLSWEALIHPDDRGRASRRRMAAKHSYAQLSEWEFRLRRANGTYAHVHEQGLIVRDADGRPLQLVSALADITERRDTDELNQRLAHASRLTAMGELTASIAHEINQPMSAILSNVDAAEMLLDAGDADTEMLRRILEDIRSDDLRASEVIKHIRGLATKRNSDFERFDINQLVESVLRLAAPVLQRRRVTVSVDSAPVPAVHGDLICIQQVLLNLLFNGTEAMAMVPEDRRLLHLSTSTTPSGMVEIAVRDCGPGVSAPQLERIFETFYTTKHNGLGLGLSIARTLVERHGGKIWAENDPDGGATFRFTLPTKPAAETRRHAKDRVSSARDRT